MSDVTERNLPGGSNRTVQASQWNHAAVNTEIEVSQIDKALAKSTNKNYLQLCIHFAAFILSPIAFDSGNLRMETQFGEDCPL